MSARRDDGDDYPADGLTAADRLAAVKALHPEWPPPIFYASSSSRTEMSRPPSPGVVSDGALTTLLGCLGGLRHAPCVHAVGGRWRCPRCGAVTPVPTAHVGPRLPACECRDVVCVHPRPGAAPPRRRRPG